MSSAFHTAIVPAAGLGTRFLPTTKAAPKELLINEGHPVHVVVHRGGRHDLGNPAGFLRAAVDFALKTPENGPDLREWLRERLDNS